MLQLLFRGSRDGWNAKIIHSKIDDHGPTITIIKTRKGKIFGGFASVPWESSCYDNDYKGYGIGGLVPMISRFSKSD
jgi:hypothetical protein